MTKVGMKLRKQAKEAGFSDEQIATYKSAESLKAAIGRAKPAILAGVGTVPDEKPQPKPEPKLVAKTAVFEHSVSTFVAKTPARAEEEQRVLDARLHAIPTHRLISVEIKRSYRPNRQGRFPTVFRVQYEGES